MEVSLKKTESSAKRTNKLRNIFKLVKTHISVINVYTMNDRSINNYTQT